MVTIAANEKLTKYFNEYGKAASNAAVFPRINSQYLSAVVFARVCFVAAPA